MRKHGIDALLPAIVGGLLAIALSLVIRSATGTKLLAEIVLDASSFGLQPRGFSFLLGVFGPAAKPLLFTSVLLGKLAFYVLLWRTVTQRFGTSWSFGRYVAVLTVSASTILVFVSAVLILTTPAALGSSTTWPAYIGTSLLTSATFAIVAGAYLALTTPLEYESLEARAA